MNEAARKRQAYAFAAQLGIDGDAMFEGATAAWSNMNPQHVHFEQALSVAAATLVRASQTGAGASLTAKSASASASVSVKRISDVLGRYDDAVAANTDGGGVEREFNAADDMAVLLREMLKSASVRPDPHCYDATLPDAPGEYPARTISVDIPAQVRAHLDTGTGRVVHLAILPSESYAGYFGPKASTAFVVDPEADAITDADVDAGAKVWEADWSGLLDSLPSTVEWVA